MIVSGIPVTTVSSSENGYLHPFQKIGALGMCKCTRLHPIVCFQKDLTFVLFIVIDRMIVRMYCVWS